MMSCDSEVVESEGAKKELKCDASCQLKSSYRIKE